jgi:hypothetical protein
VDFPLPFIVRGVDDGELHLRFEFDAVTAAIFSAMPRRLTLRSAA